MEDHKTVTPNSGRCCSWEVAVHDSFHQQGFDRENIGVLGLW